MGGLAIPAMFGFSWLAWRNSLTAHFAAAFMAVSPYGIYLAQEARHYTLSILWIIASLSCMMVAIDRLSRRQRIPWLLVLVWIVINALGMATHYFFCLALALEGFVAIGFWFWQNRDRQNRLSWNYWLPLVVVGLGSLAACLVWLPVASSISDNELTDWIETSYDSDEIWLPLFRLLAWLITMVAFLPVEGTPLAVTITSGVIILGGMVWTIPKFITIWRWLLTQPNNLTAKLLTGYITGAIGLYLFLIYGYGKDVSLAARYHFVYFPVILVILAAILAQLWQQIETKKIVVAMLIIGFLGSLTVANDLGFKKSRRANGMAQHIQKVSPQKTIVVATMVFCPQKTIVATTYDTHSQLREAIALALAFKTNSSIEPAEIPDFLLLERDDNSKRRLQEILASQPKPLNLWDVNLKIYNSYLSRINCMEKRQHRLDDSGYKNRLYHCYN